jgi:NAD(P)-dependent dehydrogenase (short-subunit alcohol dehydrogenase family)
VLLAEPGASGPERSRPAIGARGLFTAPEAEVVLRATLPTLPALRALHGRIVQVSSLTGQFACASSGFYSASKAAVELLSEALAAEVARPACG